MKIVIVILTALRCIFPQANEKEYAAVVTKAAPAVYKICAGFAACMRDVAIEDLLQETSIRLLRIPRKAAAQPVNRIAGFIKRTCQNVCLEFYRRSCYKKEFPAAEQVGAETLHDPKIPTEELLTVIESIPRTFKTVILLKHFEEYTLREIAEIQCDSPEAVKKRYQRGMQKLREAYQILK